MTKDEPIDLRMTVREAALVHEALGGLTIAEDRPDGMADEARRDQMVKLLGDEIAKREHGTTASATA